jgi:hypothetical protein
LSSSSGPKIAIAPFLRACPAVITLGVRASVADYSAAELELLRQTACIFFPTPRFAELFRAAGKTTFPCATTYQYQRSRLLQQFLFDYAKLPSPRTRAYYGMRQRERILKEFAFPLVVLSPDAGQKETHLVTEVEELDSLTAQYRPVLIREALPWVARVRMVFVQYQCLSALRVTEVGAKTAEQEPIALSDACLVEILARTEKLLRSATLEDIVVEWGYAERQWWILRLARPPAKIRTIAGVLNRHQYLCELIQTGAI